MRKRMSLITSAVMALICLAVTAMVLVGVRDIAAKYQTEEIVSTSLRVIYLTQRHQLPEVLPVMGTTEVQVMDSDGSVVAATPRLVGKPRMARFVPPPGAIRAQRVLCRTQLWPHSCMTVIAFRIYQPAGDYFVHSADRDVPWYVDIRLISLLIGGSLALVALTAFGTYRTVGRTLAPVDAMRSEMDEIHATGLSRRVPVPPYDDEIRRLALTVNQTLSRLEDAVEKQRRFASDASHDLRSPLTAMRAEVEDALMHPEDTDWNRLGRTQLDSLERLEALVSDLLMLSRLDAGAPSRRDRLDLSEMVRGELDRRTRRVPVVRKLEDGVEVLGDRLRLSRLLTNLVDNAERHAAGEIAVNVSTRDGDAVLEVIDDGAGISPEQREVIFQRFTRLDAARTKDAGGTGLGLPIAREIAQEHGGGLCVGDSPHGARFIARFPLAPPLGPDDRPAPRR